MLTSISVMINFIPACAAVSLIGMVVASDILPTLASAAPKTSVAPSVRFPAGVGVRVGGSGVAVAVGGFGVGVRVGGSGVCVAVGGFGVGVAVGGSVYLAHLSRPRIEKNKVDF